ncbi:hypothetical protein [Variovorax rhizosphaerae]|uniref:Uncharacterized protein n=1 Tax=Variovorax rhizosphaerae TaxID=1836200 RepID=A0ABU8WYT3_9BURK
MRWLFFILGIPATFIAAAALFGWRYRKAIVTSMFKSGAMAVLPPVTAPMPLAEASQPLRVERIGKEDLRLIGSAAERAVDRANTITRSVKRCYLISGGTLWSTLVVLHAWVAPPVWHRALSLVVLFAALPGLIVLVNVVAHSWRTWAVIGLMYCVVIMMAIAKLGWYSGSASLAIAAALDLANVYAWPALAMLLLLQRRLRPFWVGIAPILVFVVTAVAAVSLAVSTHALPEDIGVFKQRPEYRWPVSLLLAFAWAAVPAAVWVFLRILRSADRLTYAVPLVAIGAIGVAADELLRPTFPIGPLLAAVPAGVLQCSVVWLFFKGFVGLETTRWVSPSTLQFHVCWMYLAIYTLALLGVQVETMSPAERYVVYGIFGGSLIAYFILLHGLLRVAWKSWSGTAPKRLLLLRVFGSADQRERLLDALEDMWRRVGRVDLLAGTDLAMRTLGSWMLECFILRRLDAQFLSTEADVDRRLTRLQSELEGDLCYPVNEICCYVDAWQAAAMKLSVASDVVLIDLRGFARENRGSEFEFTYLIWRVPLARVVVLVDKSTDEAALIDVATAAWATCPRDSPNADARALPLRVLALDKSSSVATVSRALFRAAYQSDSSRSS